jgi:hypothetical protein
MKEYTNLPPIVKELYLKKQKEDNTIDLHAYFSGLIDAAEAILSRNAVNTLISIGYTGDTRCYLNITTQEAIERYIESEGMTREEFNLNYGLNVVVIPFNDEFRAYSVY